MNTTVFSLENLAVTEYTTPFTGISGDFESTAAGVYAVGGTTDDEEPIASSFAFGLSMMDSTRQRRAKYLYIHGTGGVDMTADVTDGRDNTYSYTAVQRHGRAARFVLGAGLRDSYLKFTINNPGTEALAVDRLDFETPESVNRRM